VTEVRTFWLELTEFARVTARRFSTVPCPKREGGGCDARLVLADRTKEELGSFPGDPDDPRLAECHHCGEVFDGTWVVGHDPLYLGEGGAEMVLSEAGPGATWDAGWMPDEYRGEDGVALCVRLPNGIDWMIDGPATGGGRWTRSGDPRKKSRSASLACSFCQHSSQPK